MNQIEVTQKQIKMIERMDEETVPLIKAYMRDLQDKINATDDIDEKEYLVFSAMTYVSSIYGQILRSQLPEVRFDALEEFKNQVMNNENKPTTSVNPGADTQ